MSEGPLASDGKAREGETAKTPCDEPLIVPFTIVWDQREKQPYTFEGLRADAKQGYRPLVVPTKRAYLPSGDYSIEGHEVAIAVERKGGQDGLADLFGTLGQGRERFERELVRLNEMYYAAVVIEAEWSEILQGHDRSDLNPKTIFRSVIAWQQRLTRIHWWAVANRAMGEAVTFRILERWWRDRQEGGK